METNLTKTNEEIFKEKMDALATSITDKAGVSGKKNLDELKEIVDNLQTGSKNEPLTITENGTYTAPEGVGYSPVEVKITNSEDMLQARVNATNSCDYLFNYYKGDNLDYIANLDTSNVTSMRYMFNCCSNLTSILLLDTSKVTKMSGMFADCSNLTSIPLLDTSKVTNMSGMFNGCSNLTSIPLLDTSNVKDMTYMFNSCSNLTSIPLLDTSNVTNMSGMFNQCTSLKSILMYGMKANFDISASTQFETEDLVTILNNLATVTTTRTLTMGATNLAKLTDEDKLIATNKNWTLA